MRSMELTLSPLPTISLALLLALPSYVARRWSLSILVVISIPTVHYIERELVMVSIGLIQHIQIITMIALPSLLSL